MTGAEADDRGGASWANDGTIWSANAGFEKFLNKWTTSGEVTVSGVDPYSGWRRARLGTGSYVQTKSTYDPWDTNTDENDLYDGMSVQPFISFTAWVRDNNEFSGSGEVRLLARWRVFEYPGNLAKGHPYLNPTVTDDYDQWLELDSVPPLYTTYSRLYYALAFYLPKHYEGDVSMHRAVQIMMRVENQHNSRVLVDEAGLSGGV